MVGDDGTEIDNNDEYLNVVKVKLTFVFKPSETKTAELLSVNSTGKHFTIFTFANFHLQGRLADHEYKNFLEIARKRTLDVVDLYRAQMQAKFIYQLKI